MTKISDKVLSIKLGAIYRKAVESCLSRGAVEEVLVSKARMSRDEATRLAGHWFTTWHLRNRGV